MHEPQLNLPFQEYSVQDPVQRDRDQLFALLAYALVHAHWQGAAIPRAERRGYNVGALLVNKEQMPVFFDLNCINSTENATQHGELRAITRYLEQTRQFNLQGFTVYSTLEPCIMCAGMMIMTRVDRVVYGQKDVDFSNGLERLALDSSAFGGYPPFKQTTWSDPAPCIYRTQLELGYQQYVEAGNERILAKFLTEEVAESIFKAAHAHFLDFQAVYPENATSVALAQALYKKKLENTQMQE